MAAKGITLVEEGHFINLLVPTSSTGGTGHSNCFHMKEASHATIYVQCGSITNGTTVTVDECNTAAAGSATAITFDYASGTAGDVFGALAARTAGGFPTGTTDNYHYVIELDASDLSDGYPYVCLHFTTAASISIAATAILSGLRYKEDAGLTFTD